MEDYIKDIHKIPFINENNIILTEFWEREEQFDAAQFIKPEDSVLELGGRYGVVSCIINSKLNNKKNHFVVEPDTNVLNALITNKNNHNAQFTIYNGIISRCPCSISLSDESSSIYNDINGTLPFISISEIEKQYNIKFTCFVADCEGCIEKFINEFPTFFRDIDTILIEEDQKHICNYENVNIFFRNNGFSQVKKGFHSVWSKLPYISSQSTKNIPRVKKLIWNKI